MARKPSKSRRAPPEPSPIPPPQFARPVPDSAIDLDHPVEYGGRTTTRIIRRRPSSAVLGRWFEQFTEGGAPMTSAADGLPILNVPIFVDETGDLVPDAVLAFLDDDDKQRVFADTDPFFPKRLAVALEALTQG